MRSNFCLLKIVLGFILSFLTIQNSIQVNVAFSQTYVGSVSSYTFSVYRNISSIGATIAPSPLSTNFYIQVVFGQYFNVNSATLNNSLYSGYSINSSANMITISFNTNSSNFISFTINNMINPFPSSISHSISLQIYNSSSNTQVDTTNASYYFNSFSFNSINSWSNFFTPGNVSTLSNLTIIFTPDVWMNNMSVKIGFNQYWTRSMQNISSISIFSSSSRCSPICVITTKGSYIQVLFNSIVLTNSSSTFTIININSPPSLQPVDVISISSIQNIYSSNVQVGSMTINSNYPNYLQGLTASTSNIVSEPVALTIIINTKNIFGPNDTITVNLSSNFQASALISLSNPLVSSYSLDTTSLNFLTFSQFNILSSSYSPLNFTLSITNMSAGRSTKPIINNTVQIFRNGYLYNYGSFDWSLQMTSLKYLNLNISNNYANNNSTLGITAIFTQALISNDSVSIIIPSEITVYSNCVLLSCLGCSCIVQSSNSSGLSNQVIISKFPNIPPSNLTLLIGIKNPIISSSKIQLCHYDSFEYVIQCSSINFPQIQQSTLSTSVITFTTTSNTVYAIANYMINVNLSSYDLNNGYMLIYFDKSIYIINSSLIICTVNGQPYCSVIIIQQIIINVTISSATNLYSILLSNIRNPTSTQPFQFKIDIYGQVNSSAYLIYYSIKSQYFSVSQPYNITSFSISRSSCINSQPSILSITLNNLPFLPSSALMIDNPTVVNIGLIQQTIGLQVLFNTSMQISLINYYYLTKTRYSFLVKTADLLYSIFQLNLIVQNCQPSYLSLDNYQISGLLGDQGYIRLVFTVFNPISYAIIYFPVQYGSLSFVSSNALLTTNVSPRIFTFTLSNIQPITLQIWNFTQASLTTGYFNIQTYFNDSSKNSYIISRNNNTLYYNLSKVTSCVFPCKVCSPNINSFCLQCYTSTYTNQYFLVNGSCVSSCPNGYYASNQTCVGCLSQCLTCNSTACITCAPSYYFLNGSCLTNCPSTYFSTLQNSNQVCIQCEYPCINCVNSSVCITCSTNYYLSNTGSCVNDCGSNYYPINGTCRKCQIPCFQCNQKLNNCTSCSVGYYFYQSTCLETCPSPLAPSTNNICISCQTPCSTCSSSPTICNSCLSPYSLYLGTCLTNCLSGYYSNSNFCILCPTMCKQCQNSSYCTICQSGYNLYNYQCISICPAKYYSQLISSNSENNGSFTCALCSENCLQCQDISTCSICVSGTYLLNNICILSCPITYYENINVCSTCSASCQYCISDFICSVCSDSSILFNNTCVQTCPYSYTQININVIVSSNLTISTKYCQNCSSLFQNCQICTPTYCQQCINNYVLNSNSLCSLSCVSGYINLNNSGVCTQCDSSCINCVGQTTNCSSCSSSYLMLTSTLNFSGSPIIQNKCVLNCPYSLLNYSGTCIPCIAPCVTCITNPSLCTSCSNFLNLFNGSCIVICPIKYYTFQFSCIPCATSCQNCDQNGCLNCQSGYLTSKPQQVGNLSYYQCYVTCPTFLPYILNGSICSQCAQYCVSCNQNQCLQCQNTYIRYGNYCVLQCPFPLVSNLGSCVNSSNIVNPKYQVTIPSFFAFPVPYSILLGILIICCFLSKFQYSNTSLSLSIYGLGCMLTLLCNVHYFAIFIQQTLLETILLLISIILNYFTNVLFLLIGQYTLFKDDKFLRFIKVNYMFYLITAIGLLTTHTNYVIYFSKLFNFSLFKAHLNQIRSLKFVNYLWAPQIFVYLLAILSAIMKQLMIDRTNLNPSQILLALYECIDLIVLNSIMLVLSILLFNKSKELYEKGEDDMTTQSTKKVIFDQSSIHNFGSVQSMQEFKIQDKNFKIYNQALAQGLLPQQSQGGFTNYQTKVDDNYDLALMFNSQFCQNQKEKHKYQQTSVKQHSLKYQTNLKQPLVNEQNNKEQDPLNNQNKKQVFVKMGKNLSIQNQLNVFIPDQQMEPQLQSMKQVKSDNQYRQSQQNEQILQSYRIRQTFQSLKNTENNNQSLRIQERNQTKKVNQHQNNIFQDNNQNSLYFQNSHQLKSQKKQQQNIQQSNKFLKSGQTGQIIASNVAFQLQVHSQHQSINELSEVSQKSQQEQKQDPISHNQDADNIETQIDFHQNQKQSNEEQNSPTLIYLTNTLKQQNNQSLIKDNKNKNNIKKRKVKSKLQRYDDFQTIPTYMFAQKKEKQKQARISGMQTLFVQDDQLTKYGLQSHNNISNHGLKQLRRSRSLQNSQKKISNIYLNQTFREEKSIPKPSNISNSKFSQKKLSVSKSNKQQSSKSKITFYNNNKGEIKSIREHSKSPVSKIADYNKKIRQKNQKKQAHSSANKIQIKNIERTKKDQQLHGLINYQNLSGKSQKQDIKFLVNEIQRKEKIRVKINQAKSMYGNK